MYYDNAIHQGGQPKAACPRAQLKSAPRGCLMGLPLVNATRDLTARAIVDMAAGTDRTTIQFINAHCVNVARRDPSYRDALAHADYLLPDGSGIAIAARLANVVLGDNLNGTDLFPEICRHAAEQGRSLYLIGGRPGIAAQAAATMRSRFPGLRIAGTRHGYWRPSEEEMLIDEINASGASIIFVGLGVPMQECWIDRVRDRLSAPVAMGVGGLFDYYSGAVARAPKSFRAVGCEWIWRLMQEPRRLFTRYILGNPLFLLAALTHAWAARGYAERLSRWAKRGFDLSLALLALCVALPLLLVVAAAIKLEDRGPIFFRQTRIGAQGKPFNMWKFRSMRVDAEQHLQSLRLQSDRDSTCFKMKMDPRITRVGRLLRRLSLDELPQIINILAGDMSIVGPRPALTCEAVAYAPQNRERLNGLPGLTCTWQVSGRADIPFERQVEMDIAYLRRRSLLGDMMLVLRTIPAVLMARGAY